MKVGVTLPQFRADPEEAIAAARAAEAGGVDGVFVFDHLWAIGKPDRPAVPAFPLLAALASDTDRVNLGTLVARVSLFPNAVLVHHFASLQRMVGTRLIAALGTGDHISEPENVAFGAPYPPAPNRRADLTDCCRRLRSLGITTWVGGRSPASIAVAVTEADAVNVWDAPVSEVAAINEVAKTWGGMVPESPADVARHLRALRDAGADWAVCAAPRGPDVVIEAMRQL